MVPKTNTYIEAILKQAGFDSFIAQKINVYKEHYKQKLNSVVRFYNFLHDHGASLKINRGCYNLNPIEKYYILYENSTLLAEFILYTKQVLKNDIKLLGLMLYIQGDKLQIAGTHFTHLTPYEKQQMKKNKI